MKRTFLFLIVALWCSSALAANFTGPPDFVAKAEEHRAFLHQYWFGEKMPEWAQPCPIVYEPAQLASGETSFVFSGGEVFGWKMTVRGPNRAEAIWNVIPHEVNHSVFASHFRRPFPRWLDEGTAVFVETIDEHIRARSRLREVIRRKQFTKFDRLFANSRNYPRDSRQLQNVYLEGFAIVDFLINHHDGGTEKFLQFFGDVQIDQDGSSAVSALRNHYGYQSAEQFEAAWYRHFITIPEGDVVTACRAARGDRRGNLFGFTGPRGNGIVVGSPVGIIGRRRSRGEQCRIVFYTSTFCDPCRKWRALEMAKVSARGIAIEVISDNPAANKAAGVVAVPTFVIIHKNKEVSRFEGYRPASVLITAFGGCDLPGNQNGFEVQPEPTSVPTFNPSPAVPEESPLVPVPKVRPRDSPEDSSAEIASINTAISSILIRISEVESKPGGNPEKIKTLEAEIGRLQSLVSELESVSIPVRIETAEGELIREKSYSLKRDKSGKLVFSPIVFKFDESILTGKK